MFRAKLRENRRRSRGFSPPHPVLRDFRRLRDYGDFTLSVLPIVLPRDDGVHSEGRSDGVTPSSRRPSKGGGMRAASQAFLQAFPNLDCFCPSFSKQILGRFVGFQGVASLPNRESVDSPNLLSPAAPCRPHSGPRPTTFHRLAPQGSEREPRLAWAYGEVGQGARSWRSSDPDRENSEPSTHSVLWKEISAPSLRSAAALLPISIAVTRPKPFRSLTQLVVRVVQNDGTFTSPRLLRGEAG